MSTIDIAHALRVNGHRVTQVRLAVWDALAGGGHVTAEELAERVWQRWPDINRTSVYRSLALFADLDLARRSLLRSDSTHWEVTHPDDEFHLVCEQCGGVEHHVGSVVDQVRQDLLAQHGFTSRSVDLTVTGRCAQCRAEDS